MFVAQSSTTSLEELDDLAIMSDITEEMSRLSIIDNSSTGDVDITVFAIRTMATVLTAIAAVTGKDMTIVA